MREIERATFVSLAGGHGDRVLYTTFRGLDSARSIFEKWISDGNKGRFGTFSEVSSPLCGEETQCNSLSHSLISDCQDSQDKDLLVGSDWVRREGGARWEGSMYI